MLLRFRAANVRSLRDEQELSLVVPEHEPGTVARELPLGGERSVKVFPLIGIFGANASGKSNVLAALVDMRSAVLNSYASWASLERVPRKPFILDPKSESEPSFFEVDVMIDEVRWTYGFELSSARVEAEWIHSYPRGHRQVWLNRGPEMYEWPGGRVRDRAQLVRRTRLDALLLSTAGTDNHPQLSPLFQWFRRNLLLVNPENERAQREGLTTRQLSGSRAHRINELLRVADLGINGVEFVQRGKDQPEIRLAHRSIAGDVTFDWRDESFGTRSWFALLGPLAAGARRGRGITHRRAGRQSAPTFRRRDRPALPRSSDKFKRRTTRLHLTRSVGACHPQRRPSYGTGSGVVDGEGQEWGDGALSADRRFPR